MNISYKWLGELCDAPLPAPRELATRLTLAGLAVDSVQEAGDDFVLEFDLTSNRPDCLSHLGVARETAALTNCRVRLPEMTPASLAGSAAEFASVEVDDADLCPRYTARVVRGVRIAPSPAWLVERLTAIGQRPINNVADITNYVLHELGQPVHAFDLDTLAGRKIVVRRARSGEKLKTLDGVERELDEEMLVIADAERAIALAGVMGGEETEISDATRDVLIESAHFKPESVRRTARVLGLHTEASYRFERGVDEEGALRASARVAALVCEIAGGTATEDSIDVRSPRPETPDVSLRFARIKGLTGLDVSTQEALRILTSLGFERRDRQSESTASAEGATGGVAVETNDSRASFAVPTWRIDVEREEDLVEEVARHAGYDKIGEELPSGNVAGEHRAGDARRRAARRALTASGFDEAVSFSFISAEHDGRFELLPGLILMDEEKAVGSDADGSHELSSQDQSDENLVTLSNPIIEGVTRMRPTLLPGLLDALRHNFNHGTRDVRLFEMGRVFAAEDGERPREQQSFALILTGAALEAGRTDTGVRGLDFYDLKGVLEAAAAVMKVGRLEFSASDVRHLRAGQAARVALDGQFVGTLGRLDDAVASAYKFKQPVFVAEVDFGALLAADEEPVKYAPLPRHPSVVRDVSLLAERRVTFAELKDAIFSLGIGECREVSLVDTFEGANVPEGKRSVTLRVEYRADERTLRDEEVEAMHGRVVQTLGEDFGAQLRT